MLNAILLDMISCFICFVILALPVPTLTQVYLQVFQGVSKHQKWPKRS